jgi:hypothetical protein
MARRFLPDGILDGLARQDAFAVGFWGGVRARATLSPDALGDAVAAVVIPPVGTRRANTGAATLYRIIEHLRAHNIWKDFQPLDKPCQK